MGIRTVTAGPAAVLVPGSNPAGFGDDVSVFNIGSATAYLDSDQPDTTTSGQPLSAGSSCVWQKGKPLWVIAPSSTTLTVSENAGNVFDAGAIAGQILSQGLATQIASAINVAGVPVIDVPAVLQPFGLFTLPTNNAFTILPVTDVSKYQSLDFSMQITSPGGTNALRQFTVRWYADASGLRIINDETFWLPDVTAYNGSVNANLSAKGPFVAILANNTGTVFSATAQLTVFSIVASLRPVVKDMWRFAANGPNTVDEYNDGNLYTANVAPLGASTAVTAYPKTLAGLAYHSFFTFGATTGVMTANLRVADNNKVTVIESLYLPNPTAVNASIQRQIILPRCPIEVRLQNLDTAAHNVNYGLSFAGLP